MMGYIGYLSTTIKIVNQTQRPTRGTEAKRVDLPRAELSCPFILDKNSVTDIFFASDVCRSCYIAKMWGTILTLVPSKRSDSVTYNLSAGNKGAYRQAVARAKVLSKGEFPCHRYHRAPVFFLYLTGAAKENFVMARSPRHASATGHPSPANPLVNQAAPWLWSRPTAKRARQALLGRRSHAR
jgi:hypothetical protein